MTTDPEAAHSKLIVRFPEHHAHRRVQRAAAGLRLAAYR